MKSRFGFEKTDLLPEARQVGGDETDVDSGKTEIGSETTQLGSEKTEVEHGAMFLPLREEPPPRCPW